MTRQTDTAVAPVVAVILLVAITVILAAVVYYTVLSISPSEGQAHGPVIFLRDTSSSTPTMTVWRVAGTDLNPRVLAAYTVFLYANRTVDEMSTFVGLASERRGNVTFVSADDRLNVGDTFAVHVVPGTDYDLVIGLRETGNVVGRAEWRS